MAASQARYLELTARKTNVEFEGQQINQQRTNLANESAGLFTQLMDLAVPIPPSTVNYTTTSYTFNDGANECTITQGGINPIQGGDYNANVTYTYPYTKYTGLFKTRIDQGAIFDGTNYCLTNGTMTGLVTTLKKCDPSDTNYAQEKAAIEQIIADTGSGTNIATDYGVAKDITKIYTYTSASGTTYYFSSSDIVALAGRGGAAGSLNNYYASNITKNKTVTERAYVKQADSGRYSSIKLESGSQELDLTAKSTTDDNAYQDAVHEFEYKQQVYQQQVNDINAKTSIIQAEDRSLELKLRQLDTEQQALSTELDSVKKVIDKNIESTFKTFSQ